MNTFQTEESIDSEDSLDTVISLLIRELADFNIEHPSATPRELVIYLLGVAKGLRSSYPEVPLVKDELQRIVNGYYKLTRLKRQHTNGNQDMEG